MIKIFKLNNELASVISIPKIVSEMESYKLEIEIAFHACECQLMPTHIPIV
jgi:hypothetical protein